MKTMLALCVFLNGCAASPVVWIQSHAAEISAFSLVAGATSAGIGAVNQAIELKENLEQK